jgi:hypothetical protein
MKKTAFTGAKVITADKAHDLIKEHGQRFFWVAFTRKNDKVEKDPSTGEKVVVARKGDIRYMNAQTGVKKGRKTPNGEGRKYSFTGKRLSSVWDRQAKAYRAFSWDNLVYIKIGGGKYVVLTEEARQFCLNHPDHEMAKVLRENGIEF